MATQPGQLRLGDRTAGWEAVQHRPPRRVQRISWPEGLPVEETPAAPQTDGAARTKPRRQRGQPAPDDVQAEASAQDEEAPAAREASAQEEVAPAAREASAQEEEAPATEGEAEPEGESES